MISLCIHHPCHHYHTCPGAKYFPPCQKVIFAFERSYITSQGRISVCTSVIPRSSTGLAKNNKIISMFVLFSLLFWPIWKLGFFRKWRDKPYTKAVRQDVLVNSLKVQQLRNNFAKKHGYFDQTVRTNLIADTYRRLFNDKTVFAERNCGFLDCILGTKMTALMWRCSKLWSKQIKLIWMFDPSKSR